MHNTQHPSQKTPKTETQLGKQIPHEVALKQTGGSVSEEIPHPG